ncbi:MAG: hypothetical protein GY953_04230, partial [bacterium]|nr:hypothetical protein [bacterium]
MFLRAFLAVAIAGGSAVAQRTFPLTEIDRIGHLGDDYGPRKFADLEFARAYGEEDDTLRIEGRDAAGQPWSLRLPRVGGVAGETRVFRADLDGNGRPDLLFSAMSFGNGRCIEGGSVTTLLFEDNGRPIPWRADTHGLTNDETIPVTLVDLDADDRAELVTSDCEYARTEERGMGEDRWISGVYEAQNARWVP